MLSVSDHFNKAVAVTPSDTVNFGNQGTANNLTSALYVGGAGDVVAVFEDDSTATFTVTTVPFVLPLELKRVNNTSTTATKLVALYKI